MPQHTAPAEPPAAVRVSSDGGELLAADSQSVVLQEVTDAQLETLIEVRKMSHEITALRQEVASLRQELQAHQRDSADFRQRRHSFSNASALRTGAMINASRNPSRGMFPVK